TRCRRGSRSTPCASRPTAASAWRGRPPWPPPGWPRRRSVPSVRRGPARSPRCGPWCRWGWREGAGSCPPRYPRLGRTRPSRRPGDLREVGVGGEAPAGAGGLVSLERHRLLADLLALEQLDPVLRVELDDRLLPLARSARGVAASLRLRLHAHRANVADAHAE